MVICPALSWCCSPDSGSGEAEDIEFFYQKFAENGRKYVGACDQSVIERGEIESPLASG
jgi:hypothetical protein